MKKLIFPIFLSLLISSVQAERKQSFHHPVNHRPIEKRHEERNEGRQHEAMRRRPAPHPVQLNRDNQLSPDEQAWLEANPHAGSRNVKYEEDEIIHLTTRQGMMTTLVFPAWEKFSNYYIGAPEHFELIKEKENILVVKPKKYGVETSLTIMGASGNIYVFYIVAESPEIRTFNDLIVRIEVLSSNYSYAYEMAGDKRIAPQLVYSDGVYTWLDFKNRLPRPMPLIFESKGDTLIPADTRIEGRKIRVSSLGSLVLKRGRETVCVIPFKTNN